MGGKEDQYRFRWEGSYKDTWEPKSSLESISDAREFMWLIRFLTETEVDYEVPEIYCDSQ